MYSLKKLWKYLLKCFPWFFKVRWVQKNQGLTFLMVLPKDAFTQVVNPPLDKPSTYNKKMNY
jgi:hypothetical protein